MDDMLVTGTEQSAVDDFFKDMTSLSIKDLGIVTSSSGYELISATRAAMASIKNRLSTCC